MYHLNQAESLDHFFKKIAEDPVNQLARERLSYFPINNSSEPFIGNTVIVTMHPTAEAGMPHTRPPNIICMPQWFPEHKKQETLLHEYIHIHQRQHVDRWNTFFQKEGWSRVDPYELPTRFVKRCRMNPDTIDQPFWQWKDRYVPLPLFERQDKPDLRQVVVYWYDREEGTLIPEAPSSFLERYGSPSQSEHPREISAVHLASRIKSLSDIDEYLAR